MICYKEDELEDMQRIQIREPSVLVGVHRIRSEPWKAAIEEIDGEQLSECKSFIFSEINILWDDAKADEMCQTFAVLPTILEHVEIDEMETITRLFLFPNLELDYNKVEQCAEKVEEKIDEKLDEVLKKVSREEFQKRTGIFVPKVLYCHYENFKTDFGHSILVTPSVANANKIFVQLIDLSILLFILKKKLRDHHNQLMEIEFQSVVPEVKCLNVTLTSSSSSEDEAMQMAEGPTTWQSSLHDIHAALEMKGLKVDENEDEAKKATQDSKDEECCYLVSFTIAVLIILVGVVSGLFFAVTFFL